MQQEIKNVVIEVDYYHRNMNNMLGVREANIAFSSRAASRAILTTIRGRTDSDVWSLV